MVSSSSTVADDPLLGRGKNLWSGQPGLRLPDANGLDIGLDRGSRGSGEAQGLVTLTQFYLVSFIQSRSIVQKCVCKNRLSRFA